MRPVHWAAKAKLDEMRRLHLAVVSERLQLAIAALLAAGTEVDALNEQHLHKRPAIGVQVGRVDLDLLARRGFHRAGRGVAAVDNDAARFATAVRREFPMVAQMRNVDAPPTAPPSNIVRPGLNGTGISSIRNVVSVTLMPRILRTLQPISESPARRGIPSFGAGL